MSPSPPFRTHAFFSNVLERHPPVRGEAVYPLRVPKNGNVDAAIRAARRRVLRHDAAARAYGFTSETPFDRV